MRPNSSLWKCAFLYHGQSWRKSIYVSMSVPGVVICAVEYFDELFPPEPRAQNLGQLSPYSSFLILTMSLRHLHLERCF